MYCTKCGIQLPTGAAFCSKCGQAVGASTPSGHPQSLTFDWETCEIVYDDKNGFWANAIGANGQYNAGRVAYSRGFVQLSNDRVDRDDKALSAHRQLIKTLIEEGWQPDGKGQLWYSERFRRQATAPKWEECVISFEQVMNAGGMRTMYKFCVRAQGPNGTYMVMESNPIPLKMLPSRKIDQERADAHKYIVEQLTIQGWTPFGESRKFFWGESIIFRRSIP